MAKQRKLTGIFTANDGSSVCGYYGRVDEMTAEEFRVRVEIDYEVSVKEVKREWLRVNPNNPKTQHEDWDYMLEPCSGPGRGRFEVWSYEP